MWDWASLPADTLLVATLGGLVVGALLGRGRGGQGDRAVESDQRIRGLEAELRVARATRDDARALQEEQVVRLGATQTELDGLRELVATQGERLRQLKAELQLECRKTAGLRHELADRAEAMVRTSVQLRDVETELGVARVGSDVILEQIARLEQDRTDLAAVTDGLRQELARRGTTVPPAAGRDPVMDC